MNLKEAAIVRIVLTVLLRVVIVATKEFGDIMQKEIHLLFFATNATRVVILIVKIADD